MVTGMIAKAFNWWWEPGGQPEPQAAQDERAVTVDGTPEGAVAGIDNYLRFFDDYIGNADAANVHQTAAVEFALGMIGRAFMLADPSPALPALSPDKLEMMARRLLATGNAVMRIGQRRRTGELRLRPVAWYRIAGNADPETWQYSIRQQRPNGDNPLDVYSIRPTGVGYDGMVHVRYSADPDRPWAGRSPLLRAGLTTEQLANIERSLKYDAMPFGGILIPTPDASSPTAMDSLGKALTNKGKITPVETTAGGFGQGPQAAPRGDYDQKRFGAMIPQANFDFRDKTALWVLSAAGIPPSLFTSEGSAQREAYRHFHTNTAKPLGTLMAAELSEKFEQQITFRWPELWESDISARSRAFASLVSSGVPKSLAAELVGLPRELDDGIVEGPEAR